MLTISTCVRSGTSAPAGVVSPQAKPVQLGLAAFERALGTRPALIRSGGTLPIVPALVNKGIPAIITGFSLPDANIHSPNERLLVEYVSQGIAAARANVASCLDVRARIAFKHLQHRRR